ncbi:MAG: hypothetical protein ACRDPA_09215, partial [Solirubrobacteraceae bacterium]
MIGLHGQAALDRNDPADRHIERKPERFGHLLDQRLDLNRLALGVPETDDITTRVAAVDGQHRFEPGIELAPMDG